jgi:hypothetical protein
MLASGVPGRSAKTSIIRAMKKNEKVIDTQREPFYDRS